LRKLDAFTTDFFYSTWVCSYSVFFSFINITMFIIHAWYLRLNSIHLWAIMSYVVHCSMKFAMPEVAKFSVCVMQH